MQIWLEDYGWNGTAEDFSITVHASSFEQAKNELESALGKYVEGLVRESKAMKSHAA
jgi:hypothetical protein